MNNVTKDGSKKWVDMSINSGGSFHELYTAEGLKVFLPYFAAPTDTAEGSLNYTNNSLGVAHLWVDAGIFNGSIGSTASGYLVYFDEEDKDGNIAGGKKFNVTLAESGTTNKIHVSAVGVNTGADSGYEIDDSDDYENRVVSDLATKTLYKTGADQDTIVITYHGDQAYADVYVTAPETTVGAPEVGTMVVTDAETSKMTSKNLIVVGGSCINSVAADLLGEAACGEAFTAKTGVGADQFLIQSFAKDGKVAVLVAGYEAADTTKAATYLMNEAVDTTVGKKYTGTSATEASLVVA